MAEFQASIISINSVAEKPLFAGYDVVVRLEGQLGIINISFMSNTKNLTDLTDDVRRRLYLFGKELMDAFQDKGRAL